MHNDPELSPKKMGVISQDFLKVSDLLKESSYQIRTRGFSDFPIFPVSSQPAPIGQELYPKGTLDNEWYYNVTYLDEFVQRKIIEKAEEFKQTFKDPDEFCCLFVMEEDFTNFVYIPYPID